MMDTQKLIPYLERLIRWGIYLYCVSVPFSIAASQIGVITALVSWLILAILKRQALWKNTVMTVPIVIFLAAQLLSVFFSIDVGRSIHEFRSYWHILVFFLVVSCAEQDVVRRGLVLTVVSTAAASLVGTGQYVYTRYIAGGALAEHRVSGTMGMYMTYSGILMIEAIVCLALLLYGPFRGKQRGGILLACVVILAALVCTLTRSAWLGFVAGIAAMGVLKDRRLLLLLLLGVAAAAVVAPQDARERVSRMMQGQKTVVREGVVVSQGDERPYLWKSGIEVIRHNPVCGVGLKNFRKAYPRYLPYKPLKNFNHAHNNFIHLGAETGLAGLCAFVMMIGAYLWYIIQKVRAVPPKTRSFGFAAVMGVFGAFIAFLTAGLFEYNFGDSEVAMLFWFLLAAPFVLTRGDEKTPAGGRRVTGGKAV
jgi:O-antigen ligase